MTASAADDGRSGAARKLISGAAALLIPLGAAVAADVTLHVVSGSAQAMIVVAFYGVAVYLLFQFGRVYVRTSGAPVYPRTNYYGEADIAPEPPGAEEAARRSSLTACGIAAAVIVVVAALEAGAGLAPVACLGAVAGIAVEAMRVRRLKPAQLEEVLRGQYVLYLRSFSRARSWIVLAAAMAAAPGRVVAILSPRRAEAHSMSWYLLGALFPVQFERIGFWATSDEQWYRVVASCMNSSRAIVFDCYGVPSTGAGGAGEGLELEIGMSFGFAVTIPTAYVTERDRPVPLQVPVPALLETSSAPAWVLRRFPALVARLRAVLTRRLSEEELAYLDRYYAKFAANWEEAMIRDRNQAIREGRPDPHEMLMSRDPRARGTA
jgi:hypothetical protein